MMLNCSPNPGIPRPLPLAVFKSVIKSFTHDASNNVGSHNVHWSCECIQQPQAGKPDEQEHIVGDSRAAVLICNATSSPDPQFRW